MEPKMSIKAEILKLRYKSSLISIGCHFVCMHQIYPGDWNLQKAINSSACIEEVGGKNKFYSIFHFYNTVRNCETYKIYINSFKKFK